MTATAAVFTERPAGLFTSISGQLPALIAGLRAEEALKYDRHVLPSTVKSVGGRLVVTESVDANDPTSPVMEETFGTFTRLARQQLSDLIGVPWNYVQRMFEADFVDLYDHNINEWLKVRKAPFLIRSIATEDHGNVVRCVMSNRYQAIDDIDVLVAGLGGLTDAGLGVDDLQITGDRTEGRMFVRATSASIVEDISAILGDYTYRGRSAKDYPLVQAGAVFSNSEVGAGAVHMRPEIRLQVCTNGMTVDIAGAVAQRFKRIHFGAALMDAGEVKWSDDTRRNTLALIQSQIKDAATLFFSQEFLREAVEGLREVSQVRINGVPAQTKAVDTAAARMKFTEAERDLIFAEFMKGQDETALGIAQAVSAAAHTVRLEDPERADQLEAAAFPAAYALV